MRATTAVLPSTAEGVGMESMPRRLRIRYRGAMYHLMARGNGRQDIVTRGEENDWNSCVAIRWPFNRQSRHRVPLKQQSSVLS